MKKLSDILSEMERQGFELGKIYTDKDRPPFQVIKEEGEMAQGQLKRVVELANMIQKQFNDDTNLEEWVESKITKAEDYLSSVFNYMRGKTEGKITEQSDIPRWEVYIKGEREPFVIASESSREAKKLAYMMLKNHKVKIKRIKQI